MDYTYLDTTIYYEKHGSSKKNIVILPGWGDTSKTFSYMISFLKNYFTVYIVDYPGFGNSVFPNRDLTIYDYSLLIYNFIQDLEIENPILIGHSFGGRIITTLLGYYHYSFSNIILMNSAGIKPKRTLYSKMHNFFYKALKKLKIVFPKKYRKKYLKYLFQRFASSDYQALPPNMMQTFKNVVNEDLKPYLKEIKSKTLLIWGNKDSATPLKDGNTMNKLISDSEIVVLDGCSHFTYLEKPFLVNQIIYEQLKDEIM